MDEGLLTVNGFLKKKALVIGTYMHSFKNASKETPVLVTEINFESNVNNNVTAKHEILLPSENIASLQKGSKIQANIASSMGFNSNTNETKENVKLKWQSSIRAIQQQLRSASAFSKSQVSDSSTSSLLKNYFKNLSNFNSKKKASEAMSSYLIPSVTQRHLLDTFGDSLRHVNKLYNEAFGYEARKVPSHIAHFVDKSVMSRLTERFSAAFDVTSSHKIRSSNDMQFSFSYYYYLMSEIESVEVEEIFDMFDTDKSGTWSDREIRTVLTRLYELPLDFSLVAGFEQMILNCSLTNPPPTVESIILHNERYYDSKLPLVTKSLISSCPPVVLMLREHFGHRKQNAYETLGEEEVAFKMIHNNLSQVLGQIDDLRKHPKKFVCLNDNMNHGTQEAEVIRAVIQDFYESLFPTRSQFELPPEYRNRFLYVSELKEWRKTRDLIRIVTYLMLAFLIIFSVFSFWKSEMRPVERYARLRNIQNQTRNPLHV
ncbi:N-acetylglucosamine-1-phosphotransferase subunits alpha/beta-like isoform X2 [Stegodyphus dumicola]|uniref:N-acetylglucosamine-1-phosphotransferase subunits alpha/beta-like isoform X2 n=1 Tax=Stegodyphus dumicola TaxID=202533 RepID=UPI0015AF8B55|nr:N-acetylglucosamine-1-phosphotransferase subunits alpha/beta-like isoform X2 [Stegodyphus dumicola]